MVQKIVLTFCFFLIGFPFGIGIAEDARDCEIVQSREFRENFYYMLTRPEHCRQDICSSTPGRWEKDIEYSIYDLDRLDEATFDEIKDIAADAFAQIERWKGPKAKFIEDPHHVDFLILLLNDEIVQDIEAGAIPNFDLDNFERFTKIVYEAGHCSGEVFPKPSSNKFIRSYEVSINYVDARLRGKRLEKCVKEEIYNTMGLIADPQGAVSLFDNGNYENKDGKLQYSYASGLMLKMLYSKSFNGINDTKKAIGEICGYQSFGSATNPS